MSKYNFKLKTRNLIITLPNKILKYISDKVHIRLIWGKQQSSNEEIKEEANNWRAILCSWIGKLNIVKMSVLLKLIYIFKAIPKNPSYFIHIDKLILMFIWSYGQKCFHGLNTYMGIPTFSPFVSVSLSIYLSIIYFTQSGILTKYI